MLKKLINHSNKIFLIDSLGACLSTLILGIIMPMVQHYIGMPIVILKTLAITAFVFFIYSLSCYLFLKRNWRPFLLTIVAANLLYCIATVVLAILFFRELTILGRIYFISEISVIGVLAYFEWELIKKHKL